MPTAVSSWLISALVIDALTDQTNPQRHNRLQLADESYVSGQRHRGMGDHAESRLAALSAQVVTER